MPDGRVFVWAESTGHTYYLDINARTIFDYIDRAAAAGAQIVCFPETQTVGYRVDIARPDTPVEPQRLRGCPWCRC